MTFKVLTLNINFKELISERIKKIIVLIQEHNPDVIFLQEVPSLMINNFRIPNYYQIGFLFKHNYDIIILSRYPCIRYDRIPLPETQMCRNLLLARIRLPSAQDIFVGTFHLDSYFSPPQSETLKMDQLLFIRSIIPRESHFIIAGDTNLLDNEKTNIDDMNELDSLPTFNKNRFDRIFIGCGLVAIYPAQLIGDATHSDHLGLVLSINPIVQ